MPGKILTITFLILSITGYTQQQTGLDDYLPLLHHNNGDMIFNPTAVNPAMSNDSIAFLGRALLQEEWMGFSDSPTERNLTLIGQIPNTMHTVGLELEWWGNSSIRDRMIRLNYSYRYIINDEQSVKAGANIDFASLKLNETHEQVLEEPSNSYFHPNLHLGVCYTIKRFRFGLSYGGIVRNKLEGRREDYLITESSLLVNYTSWKKLGSSLKFRSDIILGSNFEKINYSFMTRFTFKEMITGGVFYNSINKSKGIIFSGLFFERFEIGYEFYFDVIEDKLLGGHALVLGYRLGG